MGTNIAQLSDPWHYYIYRYVQLNRLKATAVYKATPATVTPVSDYHEAFSYDGNGNILTANRYAGANTKMDSLTYHYNSNTTTGRLMSNRLTFIHDAVATHNWPYGLDNQASGNYRYDAIGNMVSDVRDTISNTNWTVYGKIMNLTNSAGTINYSYDPGGQRVTKLANGTTTYYIRDAQGNTIALYDNKNSQVNLREIDLYGSSRLGMWQPNIVLMAGSGLTAWDTVGKKEYELTNHLGNVWATITDKRLQHSTNGTTVDYFNPDIATAQEYYAFGGLMPGRVYTTNDNYAYGFNGKRNDNDVKGLGNQIDYGNRIDDPRVGRFLSVDPIAIKYPWWTPYQFAGNMPTKHVDIDGLEVIEDENFTEVESDGLPPQNHLYDEPQTVNPFPGSRPPESLVPSPPNQFDLHSERTLKLPNNLLPIEKFVHPSKLTDQDIKEIIQRLQNGTATGQDRLYQREINKRYPTGFGSQLLDKKPNSAILSFNLIVSGINRPPYVAAHHIVAGNDPRAEPARKILKKEGIDINEALNGVFLPLNSKYENLPAATHSTLHTDDYYNKVNQRLENAEPGHVGDALKEIGQELLKGTF